MAAHVAPPCLEGSASASATGRPGGGASSGCGAGAATGSSRCVSLHRVLVAAAAAPGVLLGGAAHVAPPPLREWWNVSAGAARRQSSEARRADASHVRGGVAPRRPGSGYGRPPASRVPCALSMPDVLPLIGRAEPQERADGEAAATRKSMSIVRSVDEWTRRSGCRRVDCVRCVTCG